MLVIGTLGLASHDAVPAGIGDFAGKWPVTFCRCLGRNHFAAGIRATAVEEVDQESDVDGAFSSSLVPGLAVELARRRDCELILDFVAKGGIHGFRSAERGFLWNVVELHHLTEERILFRKIMRN